MISAKLGPGNGKFIDVCTLMGPGKVELDDVCVLRGVIIK